MSVFGAVLSPDATASRVVLVAPEESIDTGGIQLRNCMSIIDRITIEKVIDGNVINGKNNEESYNDQESVITDVECTDEGNEYLAVQYISGTKKNRKGVEVKESAYVEFGKENTEAERDKAEGTSLPVARSALLFGLKQLVSDLIRSPSGLFSVIRLHFSGVEVKKSNDVQIGNQSTEFGRGKAGDGMSLSVVLFCLVLASACGLNCCAANDLNHCGDILHAKTLKYGETYSFVCPTHQNGLKLYADGHLAYSGYEQSIYSWLQVEWFEDGYNFTITAGEDTPRCFHCFNVGFAKNAYFLIHSEPKDVGNVSTGFTNPDVETVSPAFTNPQIPHVETVSTGFTKSGVENGSGGFNIIKLMIMAMVLAIPVSLSIFVGVSLARIKAQLATPSV